MAITRIGNPAIADQRGVNFRNIIINGDMSIAQRGTSATALGNGDNGYHTCDRWRFFESGAPTAEFTMSQSTDVPSGQGFATSLKLDCTTAQTSLASSDVIRIEQRIEGQNLQYLKKGTANAESVTCSFWVKSSKTGTFIVELNDSDNLRQISKSYTINSANTWEKKTITYDGDTTGTLDNDSNNSIRFEMFLLAGTDFTSGTLATTWQANDDADRAVGQVNLADSTSNEWYITGVQLEAGQVASDFEFLPVDVNEERCRRYFQKSYTRGEYAGTATNVGMISTARLQNTVTNRPTNVFFRPILRATPTITLYSIDGTSGSVSDLGTGASHTRNETANASVLSSMGMGYLTGVSGLTAGDGMGFHYTADAEL
jgi:hypothetical protein